ncbi:MAG: M14 family zinc carboxypeptidase [candidate division Zixibacteria bacterium]|nr:M14 family zinc carboxypeptidase [candidate division Zixibacteria bacterium]
MRYPLIYLIAVALLISGFTRPIRAESASLVTVDNLTKEQYLKMAELGLEVIEARAGRLDLLAWPGDLKRLAEADIPFVMQIDDLTAFYKSRYAAPVTMGGFRTLSEIESCLDSLAAIYTGIMTPKFSIGKTIENRDLWVVKVSDNPGTDEDEPEVGYIAMIHSREPAAGASLLHFLIYMLENYGSDPEVTELVNNRELFFLPCQNPDGYAYNQATNPLGGGMWRKNRRDNGDGSFGIDLNRNYGFQWGFDDVGSSPWTDGETYRGPAGFSEPETQHVKDFILSREFVIVHNLHTYSNLEIWPYSYDRIFSHEEDFFKNLGDSMTRYNGYDPGVGWTLYPTNGDADDWGWGDTLSKDRYISLTCEIGSSLDGFWPDPSRIPELVEENIWPNLFLARIADKPYVIGPPKAPTIFDIDSPGTDYTVEWSLADSINPAVSYRLLELQDRQTLIDDCESNYGYWDITRMSLTAARRHSGTTSWYTESENRSHHWLLSVYPYEVKPDDTLRFWMWYAIEQDWDYFYAQISKDGGFTFTNLANELTTSDNPNGTNLGNGITGSSGGWVEAKFGLSAYEGQQVFFRLSYFTDYYYTEEGVYIDDIANVQYFSSTVEVDAAVSDTFYEFTARENGDYWYRVQAADAEGQTGRLSNIAYAHVETAEGCCAGIRGNANNDSEDKTNISDVTFMLTWLFGIPTGPAPACIEEANANGDIQEKANISDVSYLLTWLFGIPSGPAPPACP